MESKKVKKILSIAGSDSGAGAGVQADLKTFAALGAYGTSVITAVTAQNTLGVTDLHPIPSSNVSSQIEAVLSDIGTDGIKTGMLANHEIVNAVVETLSKYDVPKLVVDPVMVSTTGARLIAESAIESLRNRLLPIADVITPNVSEAEALIGNQIQTMEELRESAKLIMNLGPKAIVITGGFESGPATDLVYDGTEFKAFTGTRINTTSTHGTGCTFASALTVLLAEGIDLFESVSKAKRFVQLSIRKAYPIGTGKGPVDHFHNLIDYNNHT
ncbi:MAG: bifunctional hydroxymethylpyrimidine kinase/phosphomethylpyrimidine kinase [SAR202 cluster bacterium]|jgi:hydroxymethylpyrimidine/phosphomethylpyrimidine kinase|nr:bifunctional hydroxymethylpyrimidine kinase/phosphomethylpyrimidine kinase [SAR202 cluster bacterium]|tara:strand:+ start:1847 stop:2662 length:816 start_codon:yes stop_codon:yes gene_type:complete